MAIYNPVLGEISAGAGISFTQNNNGVVVISTAGGSSVLGSELFLTSAGTAYSIALKAPDGISASSIYNLPASVGNQGNLLIINNIVGGVANLVWASAAGSGLIVGVTGTTNRISVDNTPPYQINPIIDISSTYVGQASLTTLGTITTGDWNATPVTVAYGGTGLTSTTAYGVLCGGTTATGIFQNAGAGTATYAFISNGASALPTWQIVDHVNLANIGINTHAQIDTFIASKDQASGIAGLDSNTKLKVSEFPNFTSTITFYVDQKYSLGSNDGSILRPYTTISAALSN